MQDVIPSGAKGSPEADISKTPDARLLAAMCKCQLESFLNVCTHRESDFLRNELFQANVTHRALTPLSFVNVTEVSLFQTTVAKVQSTRIENGRGVLDF